MVHYAKEYCDEPTNTRDVPPGAIGSGLSLEFDFALNDLEEVVGTLGQRLHPALIPSYDYDEREQACSPAPVISPLRTQLQRTHKVAADLRGLIDRLEV